ncbi:MAG: hypothetical protein LAT67_14915 [Balneolales bacterium]|nr:hypothetical protein [Balneolales bacterium]
MKQLLLFFVAVLIVLIFPRLSDSDTPASRNLAASGLYAEGFYSTVSYFKEERHLKTGSRFDAGYAPFSLIYREKTLPYHFFTVFALPGEHLFFQPENDFISDFMLVSPDVFFREQMQDGWVIYAPAETGLYAVDFIRTRDNERIRIQIIVMVPFEKVENGRLNGFRIGEYPSEPLNGNPRYLPPRGFVEVTPEMANIFVSPHFRLGQFLCKQEDDFPKYLVLKERLLLQLEHILEESNRLGYRASGFYVMSGYRTPWYNSRIGNGRYSRHIYGDAADIFIDTSSRSGMMDDLNKDGKVDKKDALILFDMIDRLQKTADESYRHGGLGLYGNRPWRGPFVHVDGRGHYARWTLD